MCVKGLLRLWLNDEMEFCPVDAHIASAQITGEAGQKVGRSIPACASLLGTPEGFQGVIC
jgi:hypothetical protein